MVANDAASPATSAVMPRGAATSGALDSARQRSLKPSRCQRRIVSGLTTRRASRHRGARRTFSSTCRGWRIEENARCSQSLRSQSRRASVTLRKWRDLETRREGARRSCLREAPRTEPESLIS
jgi:hypothetical protein